MTSMTVAENAPSKPSTAAIIGAIVFWVVATVTAGITASIGTDRPSWVWLLRYFISIGAVIYVAVLILNDANFSHDTSAFDLWTIAHFSAGVILGLWLVPFWVVAAATILWEVFEYITTGIGDRETMSNRLVDIGVAWLGWAGFALLVTSQVHLSFPWLSSSSPAALFIPLHGLF